MLARHGDDWCAVMKSLWRTAVVFFSFGVSSLAAAAALMGCLAALDWLTRPGADTADLGFRIGVINAIVIVWLIIAVVTFLPAGLTIAYAELKAKRNISFFIGMGIFIAMLPTAPFIALHAFSTKQLLGAIHWTGALASAGFVAGFVYWAIAGRKAGLEDEARPSALR